MVNKYAPGRKVGKNQLSTLPNLDQYLTHYNFRWSDVLSKKCFFKKYYGN